MRLSILGPTRGRLFRPDEGGATVTPPAEGAPATPPAPLPVGRVELPAKPEKTFTQAELEAILQDRLAREARKAQEAADKARKAAEEQALREQGQFKALAEQHAGKIAELEPRAAQAQRYEQALRAQLAELRKGLPDHLAPLLDKMDPAEQLEYLAAHGPALRGPAAPNINAGGAPAPADPQAREAELRARYRI